MTSTPSCGRCGRAIAPRSGVLLATGERLCELCAQGPGTRVVARLPGAPEPPEPGLVDELRALSHRLRRASLAAARRVEGASAAEDAAILALVAERDAGDTLSQGGTEAESLDAVARAARAAADAMEAAAQALRAR